MTFAQALKDAKTVYSYFECANGASVDFRMTKAQVREIAHPSRLSNVYDNEDPDATASWTYDDGVLHIHFAT